MTGSCATSSRRRSTGSECLTKKSCWGTVTLIAILTSLTVAIALNTAVDMQGQAEQSTDIDDLETWQAEIEQRLEGRWMESDHHRWAERLRSLNPDLRLPERE